MLDPPARGMLRRVLIHDHANRDAVSSLLLRYRDERGDDWADIIDTLTEQPEAGRQVVRLLVDFEAADNVKKAGQAGKRRGSCPPFGARNA